MYSYTIVHMHYYLKCALEISWLNSTDWLKLYFVTVAREGICCHRFWGVGSTIWTEICSHELLIVFLVLPLYVKFGRPVTDSGVPYTVTVRASTVVGEGEPVSIVVFSVEQGNDDYNVTMYCKILWHTRCPFSKYLYVYWKVTCRFIVLYTY